MTATTTALGAYDRVLDALRGAGSLVRARGDRSASATCPAHDDGNPSLSITAGEERVLINCQAGCSIDEVVGALRLTMADLFDEPRERRSANDEWLTCTKDGHRRTAEYRYVDAGGRHLFTVCRCNEKCFPVWRPDPTKRSGRSWSMPDGPRPLYRLPNVIKAVDSGETIYVVEGEKDVHALEHAGAVGTCNPGGAGPGKWRDEHTEALYQATVVVVADRDAPGRAHAARVALALAGVATSVTALEPITGKDISDHLAAGRGLDELLPAAPDEQAGEAPAGPDEVEVDEQVERDIAFNRAVTEEARKIKVRAEAQALVATERAALTVIPPFDAGTLREVLDRPPDPPFRIEGLHPFGGSMLVVAQRKTGKTTLELNLARCLLASEPFLDRFDVRPVSGKIGFLNYEVSAAQLARWAQDVGVDDERLLLVNLRGRRNPLSSPEDRERLAELLVLHSVSTLIVDPFGRAFGGTNQNDAGEVGAWLADLDRFAAVAGVTEIVLSAHAGWNGERTRGSTALDDWADSIVTLVRDKDDESQRFLSAIGRDVEVDEDRLLYDPATRTLRLSGNGSRRVAADARKVDGLVESIVEIVTEAPGLNIAGITRELREREIGFRTHEPSKAAARAVDRGLIHVRPGRGTAKPHYPGRDPSHTLPDPSPGGGDDPLPTLSIGEGVTGRVPEPEHLPATTDLVRHLLGGTDITQEAS